MWSSDETNCIEIVRNGLRTYSSRTIIASFDILQCNVSSSDKFSAINMFLYSDCKKLAIDQ